MNNQDNYKSCFLPINTCPYDEKENYSLVDIRFFNTFYKDHIRKVFFINDRPVHHTSYEDISQKIKKNTNKFLQDFFIRKKRYYYAFVGYDEIIIFPPPPKKVELEIRFE